MGMTERLTGTARRITVINPFDGTEVGAVADMPPEDAPAILRIASEGARTCRAFPGTSGPACSTPALRLWSGTRRRSPN
jgi:hypothetical protein